MAAIKTSREPTAEDKQAVKELFYRIPLLERGKPLYEEMLWVLLGRRDEGQHVRILPDYCYNIFDVFTRTYFEAFPSLEKTVQIKDQAGLQSARTIEEIKQVLFLEWINMGQMFGIGGRCIRYADLEAKADLEQELAGISPEKEEEMFKVVFGQPWLEQNREKIAGKSFGIFVWELQQQHIAPNAEMAMATELQFHELAYDWGENATPDLHGGVPDGYTGFLNADGQLAGESPRAGIYVFLLLAWPEIKVMQESAPKKTVTDLHEWLLPFMRAGVITYLDLDTFRDVCAPPSQKGIGLSLRPLKSRPAASSAD